MDQDLKDKGGSEGNKKGINSYASSKQVQSKSETK